MERDRKIVEILSQINACRIRSLAAARKAQTCFTTLLVEISESRKEWSKAVQLLEELAKWTE